jgi:AraC family transcriptional regulator of adaptative response/methylated-DNA-[protein]-cysteine methyltransferase
MDAMAPVASDARDDWWSAVVGRDAAFDGKFLFAVRTTGVYCRPSCGARTPNRDNVRFFDDAAQAEAAGYRACRRCRPLGKSLNERRSEAVAAACRLIGAAETAPDLATLAAAAGMSPHHFHRVFKQATGVTPKAYAAGVRAERARSALQAGETVTAAIYDAGYNASSRFYEEADRRLGMPPRSYRDGGRGASIRFAVGETSLGSILVAATDAGVCTIELGDDPSVLVDRLQERFSHADLRGGDEAFETLVAQVVAHVEDPSCALSLPLDVRGTAFQQRVWRALRHTDPGETLSYAELARRIGEPRAVRAVASACASNEIALAIPCHRVVRSDGTLSGYRWGVERKGELLRREGRRSA